MLNASVGGIVVSCVPRVVAGRLGRSPNPSASCDAGSRRQPSSEALAEVVVVDRQRHCERKRPGMTEQHPRQKLPILEPPATLESQVIDGPEEGKDVLDVQVCSVFRSLYSRRRIWMRA